MPVRSSPFVAALVLLAACSTNWNWRQVEADALFEDVWGEFAQIAARNGYPEDMSKTDRGQRKFVSRWRSITAPFRRSERTRVIGEFAKTEAQHWQVRFYVERQTVGDMAKGFFDVSEADWSNAGQDRDKEDLMFGQLRLTFGQELGIQPSYRR